jgi:hypothetical protein
MKPLTKDAAQPPGGEGLKFHHWFRSEPRSQHKQDPRRTSRRDVPSVWTRFSSDVNDVCAKRWTRGSLCLLGGEYSPRAPASLAPPPQAVAPRADALRSGRDSEDGPHADVHDGDVRVRCVGGFRRGGGVRVSAAPGGGVEPPNKRCLLYSRGPRAAPAASLRELLLLRRRGATKIPPLVPLRTAIPTKIRPTTHISSNASDVWTPSSSDVSVVCAKRARRGSLCLLGGPSAPRARASRDSPLYAAGVLGHLAGSAELSLPFRRASSGHAPR